MRKLTIALSAAILAGFGMAGSINPAGAMESNLRIVHQYPNPGIDDDIRPVFDREVAWFRQGGTSVKTVLGDRQDVSQQADSTDTVPLDAPRSRPNCLHNLDTDGAPIGPLNPDCL